MTEMKMILKKIMNSLRISWSTIEDESSISIKFFPGLDVPARTEVGIKTIFTLWRIGLVLITYRKLKDEEV